MRSIFFRTTAYMILLQIIPTVVWISGWKWNSIDNTRWIKVLFLATETATKPWSIITHILLFLWFSLRCLRYCFRTVTLLFIILSLIISMGQSIKSIVKKMVQEPRPFVIWLEKIHHVPVNDFYALKCTTRSNLIRNQLYNQKEIPMFLRKHWQEEVDFSFPSGHAIFTTTWTLLSVSLFWIGRFTASNIILLIWSCTVIESRMLLGMHLPKDLVVAILISWILVILTTWFIRTFIKIEFIFE